MTTVPHLVQYQGSKRSLAPKIAEYFPERFNRFIEPFSGTAAMSIYTALNRECHTFILNDINKQVIELLEKCINEPENLVEEYRVKIGRAHV